MGPQAPKTPKQRDKLNAMLTEIDEDGSGKVDMAEYLQWSLKDALARSSSRVVDLFRAWDEDKSGTVDKKEFAKAVRSLGFDVEQKDCDAVFDSLDDDKSGALEYKELNEMLRKGVGSEGTKANLKRMASKQKDGGRMAKVTRKNIDSNYVGSRVSALPPTVKLDAKSDKSIAEQLFEALKAHSTNPHSSFHPAEPVQPPIPLSRRRPVPWRASRPER